LPTLAYHSTKVVALPNTFLASPKYSGLRLSAEEFLALPDDGHRYELIDGVVISSPGPLFGHQDVRGEVERQLRNFCANRNIGWIASEVDIRLRSRLVYRTDLVFVDIRQSATRPRVVETPPALVVEVLSPSNAATDLKTKRDDYEKASVLEYWIINPMTGSILALRLKRGRYVETEATGDALPSVAIPGFALDLRKVREHAGE
jgi:Uma2 family endonuclease